MSEDAYGTWKAIVRDVAAEIGLVRSMSLNVDGSPPDEDDNISLPMSFHRLALLQN